MNLKVTILLFFLPFYLSSQLKVAGIFSDNAVIQQGIAAPVWGKTSPGAEVSINFAGFESKTLADENGSWLIRLMPLKSDGKSYDMVVTSGSQKIVIKNVVIGEVWFASGQSNMEWKVGNGITNSEYEIANANYPNIRFYSIKPNSSAVPLDDLPQKNWEVCSPTTIYGFSAVSYFFARDLFLDKNIPVGVIVAAKGATNLETWMSKEKLMTHPDFTEEVSKIDSATWNTKVRKCLLAEKERENIANYSLAGINQKVHTLKYNDAGWSKTEFPLNMSKMNYTRFWGIVWLRKSFELNSNSDGNSWKLTLPIETENDRVYLNGKEVARSVSKLKDKTFTLPNGILKKGNNVLAIRMYVNWGVAEIGNGTNQCYFKSSDNSVVYLDGTWTHNNKIEPPVAQWQDFYNTSTVNFNAMINPAIPYGIRGFLWYQGENNAGRQKQYAELQPMLIDDWRVRWQQGYLPFLFVQLASYRDRSATPKSDDEWAKFRDAQQQTLRKSPNTAMACAIDIGEANYIHPKNKQDVGKRLYLAAKAKAYGIDVVYSGPVVKNAKTDGNLIKVSFDFAQNGLKTKNNEPVKGFAIENEDGKLYWVDGQISSSDIIINLTGNSKPKRIQYAWQSNPECNLYNNENLPAVPFNIEITK